MMRKLIFSLLVIMISISLVSCNGSGNPESGNPKEPEKAVYEIKDDTSAGVEKEIAFVFSNDNTSAEKPIVQTFCGKFEGKNELVNSTNYPGDYVAKDTFDVSIKGISLTEQKSQEGTYVYTINPIQVKVYADGGMISFSGKVVSFTDGGDELTYNVVYDEILKRDTLVGEKQVKGTELINIKGLSYCVDKKIYPVVKITGISGEVKSTIVSSAADAAKAIPFYFGFK